MLRDQVHSAETAAPVHNVVSRRRFPAVPPAPGNRWEAPSPPTYQERWEECGPSVALAWEGAGAYYVWNTKLG